MAIQPANVLQNFLAGRQVAAAEDEAAQRNQFLLRDQQMQEQRFAQEQEEYGRQQQFNALVGDYLGRDTVDTLGVPQPQQADLGQLYALDPQRTMQLQQFQQQQAQIRQQQEQEQAKQIVTRAQYALKSQHPATLLRIGFPDFAKQLAQQGVDVDNLDDDTVRGYAQTLIEQYGPIAGVGPTGPGEQFTLSEGQVRFDAQGRPIASVAKDDSEVQDKAFNRANTLRDEFVNQTGGFSTVRSAYENVKSAERGDAGDTALVLNYMRTISPGIRIQPGESIEDAASVPGVPTGVISMWNKLVGGGKLNDSQRGEIRSQAKASYETQERLYKKARTKYSELAKRAKVDPLDVVGAEEEEAAAASTDGWTITEE